MIRLGLIGYPLGHSLSPKLHEAALKSCSLNGSYSRFPIHPEDQQGLQDLLARVRAGEISGLNVTIPHKQNVIPLLDELTPIAKAIGAVNTIYCRDGKLMGDNTDAPGFLADLQRAFDFSSFRLPPFDTAQGKPSVLVLGAGGSARAVVYALANDGWNVYLTARRIEQADQLADSFANYKLSRSVADMAPWRHIPVGTITACQLSDFENHSPNLQSLVSNLSLIINTTPVGMFPHIGQSPWPENLPLPAHAAIYDLVYNPRVTKLVNDARQQGLQATTGLGMLVEQAALAFELWTGHQPSREIMFASVEQSPVSNL